MDELWIWMAWGTVGLGVAGLLRAGTPAAPLVFAGQLLHAWATDFAAADGSYLVGQLTLAALATVIDQFSGTPAAKRMAVPRPARLGAAAGGVLGALTLGPLGTVVGPPAGAGVGLLAAGDAAPALDRAGCRAVLGLWLGMLAQAIIVTVMAASFVVRAG